MVDEISRDKEAVEDEQALDFVVVRREPGVRDIRKALSSYEKEFDEGLDSLRVYAAIMELQRKAQGRVKRRFEVNEREVSDRIRSGLPLLEEDWYRSVERELFIELLNSISRELDVSTSTADNGWAAVEWDDIMGPDLGDALDGLVDGDTGVIKERLGDAERAAEAADIMWEALVPFASRYASVLQEKIDQPAWQKGICPVCGSLPLMGKLRRGDGLRLLECPLCRSQWMFPRIGCPFCGNREQKTIHFLYVNEDRSRRINICEKCMKYVKTSDGREKRQDLILPLEYIATMYLDDVAQGEGYSPGNMVSG